MLNGKLNSLLKVIHESFFPLHHFKSCSSPIASQQFAGRGADDFNNELTQMLDRVLNGPQGGLNLEKLCIIPGQQCWIVYIDAIVSSHSLRIIFISQH
jgi:exosome complex RNA-binding protein Rrp42 (RNase PH superfamily)